MSTISSKATPGSVRSRRPGGASPRRGRTGRSRRLAPYLFVLPFIAIFLAFTVYPLIFSARLSFTEWHGTGAAEWIGWDNYAYLLTNPRFWGALANSGTLWLLIVPLQMAVAVVAGVLLNSALLRWRGFYRVSFILPFVTPVVAVAQIWVVLFDKSYGAVNAILGLFGTPDIGWLTTTAWAKPTLALLVLWKTTGFIVIIMLSGLQSIDSSLYEAASIDGASKTRQLWSITIPLLLPTIMFAVVIQTLAVFKLFAEPFVLTQGGPYNSTTTAGLFLYKHITRADLGTGAAASLLLVILVMLISLFFVRTLRAKD